MNPCDEARIDDWDDDGPNESDVLDDNERLAAENKVLRDRQAELLRLCEQRERNSGGHLPYIDTHDIWEILTGGAS